jgi:uncharacterized protein (DUF2141 family)
MTQEITVSGHSSRPTGPPSRWQENHGNLLLVFVAIVFVLGGLILIYCQNRFVAPRFPESKLITPPARSTALAAVAEAKWLTIRVVGAANDNGTVKIAIYDTESTFNSPSSALISESVAIRDGEATWTIPVEMPDKFSIAAFHDENDDSQLNRNRLDVPTERYGYSRNARRTTGLPNFQDAVIDRPKAGETLNVFIR